MHETATLRKLFQEIERLCSEQRMKKVRTVTIRMGALSSFSPEHFREHFYDAAQGTSAEDAQLILILDADVIATDAQSIILEALELEHG